MQQTESLETDATVCEIDAHLGHNYLSLKTIRRHQKSNQKLLKFKIDAQKFKDCCSRILTIKNGSNPVFEPNILAGVEGLEPSRTVLETGMLPLHHTPKERHIKFLLCNIYNIGTRLWRPACYHYIIPLYEIMCLISVLKYYTHKSWHCQEVIRKNM